ncbi:NAD(P)H-binding protein [Agaribacter marinus]|uniref:Oxidoreductase n=1 Tax=Agaribacter marinus TaxID=1431249 RepID=A0AA37WLG7_9ALTE|nr:NAD(P)H-binding protein [Agaribacter marinus]GLR72469.1 oxidoreductase [Agaribacter marinus]
MDANVERQSTLNRKTALVLGASGAVGRALVNCLCADVRYHKVVCLVRSPLSNNQYCDPERKLEPLVIDFQYLQDYQGYFTVDHVYCCLGTTLKKAGSKKAFRYVDFELVHIVAQLSRAQRVKSFVWISSIGANAKSKSFYLRVKGELENAVLNMPQLNSAAAVRPSLIDAHRQGDTRRAEALVIKVLYAIGPILLGAFKKYRPVKPIQVAKEMVRLQTF